MSYTPTSTNVAATSHPRRGTSSLPRLLVELLEGTGVALNGASPYDIQVHDP
jgi:hypothetical protein